MKKGLFIFFLIFVFLLFIFPLIFNQSVLAGGDSAAPRPLETIYPEIPGTSAPTQETGLAEYLKYIFNFLIWGTGFIVVVVIIYNGFKYLTSSGLPEKVTEAKDRIKAALLGLIILFGSYMLLITINPQLIAFYLSELPPIIPDLDEGILLCKEEVEILPYFILKETAEGAAKDDIEWQKDIKIRIEEILADVNEKCWMPKGSGPVPKDLDNELHHLYLLNSGENKYGAILYDERNYKGEVKIFYTVTRPDKFLHFSLAVWGGTFKPSSVKLFRINENPSLDWYAEIYESTDFNRADPSKNSKKYGEADLSNLAPCYNISDDFPIYKPIFGSNYQIQSLKIEGDLIVVFFKNYICGGDWFIEVDVYPLAESDHNLQNNHPLEGWGDEGDIFTFAKATSIVVLSATPF